MHNGNEYYKRMLEAEFNLKVAMDQGRKLLREHEGLARSHYLGLTALKQLAEVATSHRHSWLSKLSRALGIKPEINPDQVRIMLASVASALAQMPAPGLEEETRAASPSPDAASLPPAPDPSEPSGAEKLRVIRGGRDA